MEQTPSILPWSCDKASPLSRNDTLHFFFLAIVLKWWWDVSYLSNHCANWFEVLSAWACWIMDEESWVSLFFERAFGPLFLVWVSSICLRSDKNNLRGEVSFSAEDLELWGEISLAASWDLRPVIYSTYARQYAPGTGTLDWNSLAYFPLATILKFTNLHPR